jgi:hypothetical protein
MVLSIQNAPQDEIDVMELTLDLVDKCSFLSGDYRDRPYVRKRLFQAEAAEFDEEIDGVRDSKKFHKITNLFPDINSKGI